MLARLTLIQLIPHPLLNITELWLVHSMVIFGQLSPTQILSLKTFSISLVFQQDLYLYHKFHETPFVGGINPLVKAITYNSGTFMLYHEESIIKYTEAFLNPLYLIIL